jgi:hypothetical protein
MKIAIMQPYFYPYAGYFRLFLAADIFIFFDCVQFPRKGWVHRNQINNNIGQKEWITLPLVKSDRDSTRIVDLKFKEDASKTLMIELSRFSILDNLHSKYPDLIPLIQNCRISPNEYLIKHLQWLNKLLGISKPTFRSSDLDIPFEIKSQDRIIAIAKKIGATHYINAPGGRQIYDPIKFSEASLSLSFLNDYDGSFDCMLQRISVEDPELIFDEIKKNTKINNVI